jgi:hypothetical protein
MGRGLLAESGPQSLEHQWPGNTRDLAFHKFPIPPLRSLKPGTFDAGVCRAVEISDQVAEEFRFLL